MKEQIIINGVTYYKQQDINEGLDEEHYITEFHLLATHYNLLLEDYARKTQECELLETQLESYHIGKAKLVQRNQELEQECEQIKEKYEALKLENEEGYEIVAELKHECEELKNKIDEYKEALEELREECEKHRNNAKSYCANYQSSCVVNAEITDIAYKYGQALNNIKNYIYKECENCEKDRTRCISCKTPKDILDIISKVKGEEF